MNSHGSVQRRTSWLSVSVASLLGVGLAACSDSASHPVSEREPPPVLDAGADSMTLEVEVGNAFGFRRSDGEAVWLLGLSVCCEDAKANGWPWATVEVLDELSSHGGNWIHIRLGPFAEEGARFEAYDRNRGRQFDLATWNEDFWSDLAAFLMEARSRGVYVEIDLIDAWVLERPELSPWSSSNNANGIDEGDCSILSRPPGPVQERWLRKVVRETARYDNVLYQIGNETFDCAGSLTEDWVRGVALIVQAESSLRGYGRRLIATNSHRPSIEASEVVDYVNVHTDSAVIGRAEKPTGVNEYADLSPSQFTTELWRAFTNGTFFHYWRGWNTPSEWATTLDRIEIFRGFVTPVPFDRFEVLEPGVVGVQGEVYVALVTDGLITLNLTGVDRELSVEWLDPFTGAATTAGSWRGGASPTFSAPSAEPWVLHLHVP